MYILSASNARDRYLDEIVRVLAVPAGGQISFRYKRKWISEAVLSDVEKMVGKQCLVCHITFGESTSNVTPVRVGHISSCKFAGDFVSINFVAESYVFVRDNESFQSRLKHDSEGIPEGKNDRGFLTCLKPSKSIQEITFGEDYSYWQKTVQNLLAMEDFRKREYNFFAVEGLFCIKGKGKEEKVRASKDMIFNLSPNETYEVVISFYKSIYSDCKNSLDLKAKYIDFISSSKCVFDTDYDTRKIRFVTGGYSNSKYSYIGFDSVTSLEKLDPNVEVAGIDFDLPIKIKSNWRYNLCVGVLLGLFLFCTLVASTTSQADVSFFNLISQNWLRLVFALISGCIASFGISKPF